MLDFWGVIEKMFFSLQNCAFGSLALDPPPLFKVNKFPAARICPPFLDGLTFCLGWMVGMQTI